MYSKHYREYSYWCYILRTHFQTFLCAILDFSQGNTFFLFFSHIFYCHFENKKVFTRLSVYSIYICKLLLIINYIYIFKQFYNYICKLLFIINKCHLYNNHLAWNCFCVLFLTAMYFSVLYLTSTCFKKTSHSGILSCFRLCHICNFARGKSLTKVTLIIIWLNG